MKAPYIIAIGALLVIAWYELRPSSMSSAPVAAPPALPPITPSTLTQTQQSGGLYGNASGLSQGPVLSLDTTPIDELPVQLHPPIKDIDPALG